MTSYNSVPLQPLLSQQSQPPDPPNEDPSESYSNHTSKNQHHVYQRLSSELPYDHPPESRGYPSNQYRIITCFRRPWKAKGWRKGLLFSTAATLVVFFINFLALVIVGARHGWSKDGFPVLSEGTCQDTENISLWIHLIINVMSTALLSASNYTMQILSSPTRSEIERAHKKGDWLNVGVNGIRNLVNGRIQTRRVVKWLLLLASSLPLHILYNSAVFTTIGTNGYEVALAPEPYITGQVNKTSFLHMRNYASYPTWEHMEIKECHHAYDQMFVAEHHDLILVTSDSEPPSIFRPSLINDIADQGASYGLNGTDSSDGPFTGTRKWAEGKLSCSPIAKPSDCAVFDGLTAEEREDCRSITERSRMYEKCRWSISNRNIKYCLSEPIAAKCTLNFHIPVMIYVVVANALKLLCMISTILNTGEDPLVTIGDSISSFLVHPDPYTQGKCTASVFTFHERESQGKPKEWDTSRYRWWKAVPGLLYIFFIIFTIAFLASSYALLALAIKWVAPILTNKGNPLPKIWGMGFGSVNLASMVNPESSALPSSESEQIILANLPQTLLSLTYLFLNSILTRMLLSSEWAHFAITPNNRYKKLPKPLRVSNPIGTQRNTYFLQVPYRYAIPLQFTSAILHWLTSQSFFFVKVKVYSHGEVDPNESFHTVGWSTIAVLVATVVATVVFLCFYALGGRVYPVGIPFARSSSSVIAAACHNPDGGKLRLEGVMWGDVGVSDEKGVRHLAFGNAEVEPPEKGVLYA